MKQPKPVSFEATSARIADQRRAHAWPGDKEIEPVRWHERLAEWLCRPLVDATLGALAIAILTGMVYSAQIGEVLIWLRAWLGDALLGMVLR